MATPFNLTGKKISLTYDKLVQVPDQTTGILQDGLGAQVYTNSDSIGTIKMFYPIGGTVSTFFNDSGDGSGVVGTPWEGWQICNGNNGSPDLRGRFIVGYDTSDSDYDAIGNYGSNAGPNTSAKTQTLADYHLPPHSHTLTVCDNFGFTIRFAKFTTSTIIVLKKQEKPNESSNI